MAQVNVRGGGVETQFDAQLPAVLGGLDELVFELGVGIDVLAADQQLFKTKIIHSPGMIGSQRCRRQRARSYEPRARATGSWEA